MNLVLVQVLNQVLVQMMALTDQALAKKDQRNQDQMEQVQIMKQVMEVAQDLVADQDLDLVADQDLDLDLVADQDLDLDLVADQDQDLDLDLVADQDQDLAMIVSW
ncbi:MAG: hypothetical protein ACK4FV_01375 [Candidatus Nitrosocaldus sp.]